MLQFSEKLLNNLMQIGLTVSLAALVPLILRRLMKKRYPARMVCVVWAILALRLLIPVQLTLPQAPVQVMPRTSYVVQSDQTAFRQAGLPVTQTPARWVTGTQAQTLSAADTGTVKTVDITDILLTLWLAGVIACVLWQGIGYYRLIRSLKGTSQPVERTIRTRFCRSSAPTWLLTGKSRCGYPRRRTARCWPDLSIRRCICRMSTFPGRMRRSFSATS